MGMVKLLSTPVLVTLNVTYFRPDYPSILNEFLWQTPDVIPDLVRVHRFLNFWKNEIEAVIHTIEVSIPDKSGSWRSVDWYFKGNA
jgi:uncharacterized protein Usg